MTDRYIDVFFYGLFMDVDILSAQGVRPMNFRRSYVEDFALRIGKRATLVPSDGTRVYGMLIALTLADLERLYAAPGLEQYRPEAVLARTFEGEATPALCYNLLNAPSPDEYDADYAARLQRVLRKLDLPGEDVVFEAHKRSQITETPIAQLLKFAAARAISYREGLNERRVAPLPENVARLAELGGPLPEHPTDAETVVALLDEIGSPATVATAGGRYFGFVIGSSLPATLAANWLAGAWDQNACLSAMSPAAIALEDIALRWLLDVLGLPPESGGAFVTGATMANFSGLAAGRHFVLKNAGWDVESRGLFGAPPVTVVVGEEAHPTLLKALGLLGLGRERVITVPVDGQGRMLAAAFPQLSGPAIVCIQAGNVNTGAFDPAPEICDMAHRAGAWVHVDGAFGLWAAASPNRAHLTRGFAQADSWATDGHKWLNVPYDSGLTFVRHHESLRAAMSLSAAYLPTDEVREPMHYTPDASRRSRGVEVWAALRSLGRAGLAEMIERTCSHATRFAEGFQQAGYRVLNDVVLNQVLVSLGNQETTSRVIAGIQADGTCWCGGTVWQGQPAMRISVSSWATTEADVERSLEAMLRVAAY
jgi:glutamate/tyrosine decarboxylase-like PLP-dependent enzyme